MVKISTEVIKKIKSFIKELERDNIHIKRAILFGSYAKGTFNEWSDIDVVLVSEDFEGISILDKEKTIPSLSKVDYDISPHPYRPEDFDESDLFVKEILETGIEINL
jgi:predicted nucleotidyltransferase